MLRSEIIGAAGRVRAALTEANILDVLGGDKEKQFQEILTAYNKLLFELSPLGPTERVLVGTFGLKYLFEADWWSVVFSSGKSDRGRAERIKMYRNVNFALEKLPQIVELLSYTDDDESQSGESKLTLLISEPAGQKSTPQRIVTSIEGITLLYRAMCRLHNEADNTLALTKCDSGSDKSFDFTGVPQIIEQVKSVIFGLMDRVIFFRERKFSERVKLVAESLPILNQIAEMVETKRLSAEQAELLKRDLIGGATKFLETGSSIPELNEKDRYRPSSLLATAPTLLLEGPPASPKERTSNKSGRAKRVKENTHPATRRKDRQNEAEFEADADTKPLSTEEQQQLNDLLKRARQTRSTPETE
jgi:hypothetical protein